MNKEMKKGILKNNKILIISGSHGIGKENIIELLTSDGYKYLNLKLCDKFDTNLESPDKKGVMKIPNNLFQEELEEGNMMLLRSKDNELESRQGFLFSDILSIINNGQIPIIEIGANKKHLKFLEENELLKNEKILIIYIKSASYVQTLQQMKSKSRDDASGIERMMGKNAAMENDNTIKDVSDYVVTNHFGKKYETADKIAKIIEKRFSIQRI